MANDRRSSKNTVTPKRGRNKTEPAQYETMSQQQNRHGKGRQQNGSDGSGVKGRGSNH
jgi:hypothetical protein